MEIHILVVDDDPDYLLLMEAKLRQSGFEHIQREIDSVKAASAIEKGALFDVALIDINMPGMDGIALLEFIKNTTPGTECIMVTAVNDARAAVDCLRRGAYDYLVKPITQEELLFAIDRSLERKRLLDLLDIRKNPDLPRLERAEPFASILTQSPAMLRLLKEAELHARSQVPVLVTGESGTGKELLARAIHAASPRALQAFVPVNMASLSATLFEAEFFGHTKGAFTGAEKERGGLLRAADHGTLFLDEIGTLPLELQGKLLRVLQDGEYTMLGTSRRQKVDVRFIAATNENLEQLMARRQFRKDLFYRIRGGWLHLPPLRERKTDIPLLIDRFLQEYCGTGAECHMAEEGLSLLLDYDWPGNVRELKSVLESAANLAQGRALRPAFLPAHLRRRVSTPVQNASPSATPAVTLAEAERRHILGLLAQCKGNKSQAARLLGIGLNTLRRKLATYGIA